MSLQQTSASTFDLKNLPSHTLSLSKYFPKGTQFYYGYPAGEDSGFINKVLPVTEELVAARPFACAGEDVTVVAFNSTEPSLRDRYVYKKLGVPQLPKSQVIVLPKKIDTKLVGKARNDAVRAALLKAVEPGTFIMAQPYTEKELDSLYLIPAQTTAWLNDKANMDQYVSSEFLAERFGVFKSGSEFAEACMELPTPVVVKASLSSSGDGVYICRSKADLKRAADNLKSVPGNILVEKYVKTFKNYALHFGVPHQSGKPIDLIGINEQIVSAHGAFMGGFIYSTDVPQELAKATDHLINYILPKVRNMGWHGIGGFDVLLDDEGHTYFIDCNFRMTGMSAYHFMNANGAAKAPLFGFSGEFTGSGHDLVRRLGSYADPNSFSRFLYMVALSKNGNTWRFNAAVHFNSRKERKQRAKLLLQAGIKSTILTDLT